MYLISWRMGRLERHFLARVHSTATSDTEYSGLEKLINSTGIQSTWSSTLAL